MGNFKYSRTIDLRSLAADVATATNTEQSIATDLISAHTAKIRAQLVQGESVSIAPLGQLKMIRSVITFLPAKEPKTDDPGDYKQPLNNLPLGDPKTDDPGDLEPVKSPFDIGQLLFLLMADHLKSGDSVTLAGIGRFTPVSRGATFGFRPDPTDNNKTDDGGDALIAPRMEEEGKSDDPGDMEVDLG